MGNFSKVGEIQITGTVTVVKHDKGYGFVRGVHDGLEYFFHATEADDFEAMTVGTAVRFVPTAGTKGPRAKQVELL